MSPRERVVYLDYNATTPVDPRVGEAMTYCLEETFGNASSTEYRPGWDAADAVEIARDAVREAAGRPGCRVLFTSGATEALNTVIQGYLRSERHPPSRVVTCVSEHAAVLGPSRHFCRRSGVGLRLLPVDDLGHLDLSTLGDAMTGSVRPLVVIMAANNEIGTTHPLREIGSMVSVAGGILLSDTTQIWGKIDATTDAGAADFATMSAHKICGPKGMGALLARNPDDEIEPLIVGGGQECGGRAGTLNVPGIVGFGEACRLLETDAGRDLPRMAFLRDRLEEGILTQLPHTWVNGDRANRLCNTTNIGFKGIDARTLIRDMHDVAVSTRSACSSGNSGPSHVLKAIGLSDEDAYSCIRFSLGRFTTREEIDYAIGKVVTSAHKLRRSKGL